MKETQRINSATNDLETILNIKECVREDAGVFEVVVTNEVGSKTVAVKVEHYI